MQISNSQEVLSSDGVMIYDDLESVFLGNQGNWKKIKRQYNKDIYKCQECDQRLEIEKRS